MIVPFGRWEACGNLVREARPAENVWVEGEKFAAACAAIEQATGSTQ